MRIRKFAAGVGRHWKLLALTPVAVLVAFFSIRWLFSLPWDSQSAPGWLQAIGSIFAILAAGLFPIWHFAIQESRRKKLAAHLVCVLTQDHLLYYKLLYRACNSAISDFGESLKIYQTLGHHLVWTDHLDGLCRVDYRGLDVVTIRNVQSMRVAARFAVTVIAEINNFNALDETTIANTRLLMKFRDDAMIIEKQQRVDIHA